MKINDQTKLMFALEHIAHLEDLLTCNEWETYLSSNLITIKFELERQLSQLQYQRNGRSKRLAELDKLD